jgi:hypothetical protein
VLFEQRILIHQRHTDLSGEKAVGATDPARIEWRIANYREELIRLVARNVKLQACISWVYIVYVTA